jgi:osmoprotectant transport system permease protein
MNARVKLRRSARPARGRWLRWRTAGRGRRDRGGRRWRALGQRPREHLALVSVSLLAAIVLAVPLGILAARRRGWGRCCWRRGGGADHPSLALLVFMVPLLGIGALPATVALFLYSLLAHRAEHPRRRGGDARRQVRESAEALGCRRGRSCGGSSCRWPARHPGGASRARR